MERLRAGRTVVLFPEGTRSPRRALHPFHRGAAHVALRAGVPLEPVAISCIPGMLGKGQPWWDVPERPGQFTIRVLDPIDPRATGAAEPSEARAARWLTAALRDQIRRSLARVGPG